MSTYSLDDAESTDHLESIAEHTSDVFVTVDIDGTISFINRAVTDVLGYDPEKLIGEPLTRLIPDRSRGAHLRGFSRYLERGDRSVDWSDIRLTGLAADGSEVPLSISFSEFGSGEDHHFVGILRDVSDRARMEAALRASEERFVELVEHLEEVVWISGPDTERIEYVNPAYESVWGRSRESLYEQPRSFIEAIHPSDRARVRGALEEKAEGTYDEEYRVITSDGEVRWVHDRGVPVETGDGEVTRVIGIATDITERKTREQELEVSQDRFELVQYVADVGYWELDPRTEPPYDVTITEALYRLHGVPTDEPFDLERGLEFYHPADQQEVRRAVERAIAEGIGYDLEARLITADDELRWVNSICEPIEANGEVVLLRGALQDITDRKRREAELERTIDRVTDAIVQVDSNWRFTFVDGRAEEIYDMAGSELLGRDFWTVFDDALGTRFETEYRQAMTTREPTTFVERFDGLDGWFLVKVFPDADGGLSFYFRDVTERKEREHELELRTAQLEAMSEATIDGLLVVDEDREVVHFNERFLEIWDLDPAFVEGTRDDETLVGQVLDKLERPEEFLASLEYLYEHPQAERRDEIRLADGRWIDRYSAPVTDDGTHYGRLWVFRDVSGRREHEQELEAHKQRLEEFASLVSHDLRNPLEVAEGYIQLERSERDSDNLTAAGDALGRMRTLIEDLLTLARSNQSIDEQERVQLAELVGNCWENVDTADATLDIETSRIVMADASRLGQLVENLLRNAIEHGGSDVRIRVGEIEGGFIVEDDGDGIPEADRDRVFESGYSSDREGTGMGLAIVQTVAEAHGWSVSVADGRDGGARFEITGLDPP